MVVLGIALRGIESEDNIDSMELCERFKNFLYKSKQTLSS